MTDQITLACIGDVFPADLPYHIGRGIAGQFRSHMGKPWLVSFCQIFDGSDIGLANLESPLTSEFGKHVRKTFIGDTGFASFLKKIGISVVSIANNHILEHGTTQFYNTIEILKNAGLSPIGYLDQYGSKQYVLKKGELRVAIAAFNDIQDLPNPSCYADYSEDNVLQSLKAMYECDFRIIFVHWGNEYVNIPSYAQVESAKRFVDAGADVIIGSHPHVIQPVLRYKKGLILFSLGNFLFDMTFSKQVRTGMAAKVILQVGKMPQFELYGIHIGSDYCPHIMQREKFTMIYEKYDNCFQNLLKLSQQDYDYKYRRMLMINSVKQRLCMKRDLFLNFHRLTKEEYNYISQRVYSVVRGKHDY